jgi:hypothetical protein
VEVDQGRIGEILSSFSMIIYFNLPTILENLDSRMSLDFTVILWKDLPD